MDIRDATEADYEFARTTHHAAYRDVVLAQFGSWNEDQQDRFFRDSWNATRHSIVFEGSRRVGYLAVVDRQDHVFLSELVVAPESQNQGIGTMLLQSTISKARSLGKPLRLQVLKKNRAGKLYERFGFMRSGETERHFQYELT